MAQCRQLTHNGPNCFYVIYTMTCCLGSCTYVQLFLFISKIVLSLYQNLKTSINGN